MNKGIIKIKIDELLKPCRTWRDKNRKLRYSKRTKLREILSTFDMNTINLEFFEEDGYAIFKYQKISENDYITKNPADWTTMAGETELEKKVNSYLTTQFITIHEIPKDECLIEAKQIMSMIREDND